MPLFALSVIVKSWYITIINKQKVVYSNYAFLISLLIKLLGSLIENLIFFPEVMFYLLSEYFSPFLISHNIIMSEVYW